MKQHPVCSEIFRMDWNCVAHSFTTKNGNKANKCNRIGTNTLNRVHNS